MLAFLQEVLRTYFHTHLNDFDSVNKSVKSGENQKRGKVPGPNQAPVLLVLPQIGPPVLIGALEENQDLQGDLYFLESLRNLSSQNIFWY